MEISSPAFTKNGLIPLDYSCEGKGSSPPLSINGIPEGTKSMVLIMDDPDARGKVFDHWIVWNIPPANMISENAIPGIEGRNGSGGIGYTPPCPPSGSHHYHFKVYALNTLLDLQEGADKKELLAALKNHIVAAAEVVGLYKKSESRSLEDRSQ